MAVSEYVGQTPCSEKRRYVVLFRKKNGKRKKREEKNQIGVLKLLRETDAEIADMSANLDIVGVNDPLLFNTRSSRLEDLVGEAEEVEMVDGAISFVLNVVAHGRRGEMPERSSSISETDCVRGGRRSTVDSSKKAPCPVKKQNLKGGNE